MIILDTNVISETLKPEPNRTVVNWLRGEEPGTIFTTAVTQAELLYGIETLAHGKRRTRLLAAVEEILDADFASRILPFDADAARHYARIVADRGAAGRPISQFDAMIAAIARVHRAVVATRNISDFVRCDIQLIDPWAIRGPE